MDRPSPTARSPRAATKPGAVRARPVRTETIQLITFEWPTVAGIQPVVFLERRPLH